MKLNEMVKDFALTCGLVVLVHTYVLLSAAVYHTLEGRDDVKPSQYYSEKYLARAMRSWSPQLKNPSSPEFKKFIAEYRDAVKNDEQMENKRAFQSLAKAYLFALTSIATVGNSGMTVTTVGGKSFYLASIITGIVLYVSMLHRISVPLLLTMRYAADNMVCCTDEYGNTRKNPYPKLTVMIICNVFVVLSILIFAVGGVFSGHTYLYGLFTTYDSVLTIGNEKWLPLLANWSETVFVLSLSLFLVLELSLVYTTIFASLDAATDNECRCLIAKIWAKRNRGNYHPLDQEDAGVQAYGDYDDYEMIGDKGDKEGDGYTFPTVYSEIERKDGYPVPKSTPPEVSSLSSQKESPRDQQGSAVPSSAPIYDQVEPESPLLGQKDEAALKISDPPPALPGTNDTTPKDQSANPFPLPPTVTIQEDPPPIKDNADGALDKGPPVQSTQETPAQTSKGPSSQEPGDSSVDDLYYEPYEPQTGTLEVPSRRSSSSGESEYSNISVGDYETSLNAELEKSREFIDSIK